ncbi:hypothetical protein B9Z55_018705 [Caenorhabditis nigoni]|nr:hypothetical protein B9Z55_018705 [Caenorhabditis nigoni]
MRGFCRRPKKVFVLVFLVLFVVWLSVTIIEFSFGLTVTTDDLIATGKTLKNGRQLKGFITSSYYYPTSKSLGDNAIALVMSINLVRSPANQLEHFLAPDPSELIIMAKNASSSVIVSAPYVR